MVIKKGDILIEYINEDYHFAIFVIKRIVDDKKFVVDYILKNGFGAKSSSFYLVLEPNRITSKDEILSANIQKMSQTDFIRFKKELIKNSFELENVLLIKHR